MEGLRILISGSDGSQTNYEKAVTQAGGLPVSGYCPGYDEGCVGLLLAGGGDIAPSFLGEENKGSREIDVQRDLCEFTLVQQFLAASKPILGICRGHQVVQVVMGGRLIQDIGPELERFHSPFFQKAQVDIHHFASTKPGSLLNCLYGGQVLCNSWHHQAMETVGEGFSVTAWTSSGLIEGAEHEALPIVTVQFHPERMNCPPLGDGSGIFDWFIDACRDWRLQRTDKR